MTQPLPLWKTRRGVHVFRGPLVMGILNVTPDSFSQGESGEWRVTSDEGRVEKFVQDALRMEDQGASWIDIGGESTRPGADSVPLEEELRRVVPVVEALRRVSVVRISIDTSKAAVARAALAAGADAINDVTALSDPGMAAVVREAGAGIVLMHSRGTPATMDSLTAYPDGKVAETVLAELLDRVRIALDAGIPRECIALDPGFGFAKTNKQNEELLRGLSLFVATGFPVLAGLSRKRFIGARILAGAGRETRPDERDAESAAAAAEAVREGALLLRVHNVPATFAALGERFDIVDGNGNPTGETIDRVSAHRWGVSHRTSHVWLVRADRGRTEILLQKRSRDKDSFPGCYDISSAGHLPAGSDYVSSALRELQEELGVEACAEDLHYLGTRHIHTESVFHGRPFINDQFSAVYFLRCDLDEDAFRPQASEVESVRWMDLDACIRAVEEGTIPNCLSLQELHWLQNAFQSFPIGT